MKRIPLGQAVSPGSPKRGGWVSFTLSEDRLKEHAAAGPRSAAEEGVCVFRKKQTTPPPPKSGTRPLHDVFVS